MNFINAHTHNEDAPGPKIMAYTNLATFSEIHTHNYFCIGIHPWFIAQNTLDILRSLLIHYKGHPNFAGLGELGLDKEKENYDKQLQVFESQVQLAIDLKINQLILHSVRAQSDILGILKKYNFAGSVLWHGFNGNETQIQQVLATNFKSYLGLGHLIFTDAKIAKYAPQIPLEAILLETDDQNDLKIETVYQRAATLKKCELESFTLQIQKNFKNFLKLRD